MTEKDSNVIDKDKNIWSTMRVKKKPTRVIDDLYSSKTIDTQNADVQP